MSVGGKKNDYDFQRDEDDLNWWAEQRFNIREVRMISSALDNYKTVWQGEPERPKEEMEFVVNKRQLLQSHAPFRLIEFNEIKTEEVEFGNKVTIQEEGKDEAEDYYLLGPIEFELDVYPMIVTYHSPFGQAMVGKKNGESFTLEIGGKGIKFTITAIKKITIAEKNT